MCSHPKVGVHWQRVPLSLCPGRGARTAPPPLPCAPSRHCRAVTETTAATTAPATASATATATATAHARAPATRCPSWYCCSCSRPRAPRCHQLPARCHCATLRPLPPRRAALPCMIQYSKDACAHFHARGGDAVGKGKYFPPARSHFDSWYCCRVVSECPWGLPRVVWCSFRGTPAE